MSSHLIVDAQVFQTAAWHRGMGKYSLELLKALQQEITGMDWQRLDLLMSSRIEADPEMVATVKQELPNANIVMLDFMSDDIGNHAVPTHNRKVLNAYISEQVPLKVSINYLIMSSMQGVIYPVFPTIEGVHKMLLFYDLIPLMFHDIYLRNSITRNEYLPRVGELLRADTYLAISKTVANDLSLYLGIDKARIASIDGGAINHSHKEKKFPINKPFILMPTGNDLRKNNRRAIVGFKKFNESHGNAYNLVITSFFKEHEVVELRALCDDVVFTGNISGAELNYLYENSEALLFPSEYEGLGMPILEAAEHNKPIACSNIPVFREMSTTAFIYFDPYSSIEMAAALDKVTTGYKINHKEYDRLLSSYTWQNSAQKLLQVVQAKRNQLTPSQRPTLHVCGPKPHASNGGRFMQELNGELSRYYDLQYYVSQHEIDFEPRINYLSYNYPTYLVGPGMDGPLKKGDSIVYHLGSGPEYSEVLFSALAIPGVVVLHADKLTDTWQAMERDGLVNTSRLTLEQNLSTAINQEFNGLASLLMNQRAVIVFDQKLAKQLQKQADLLHAPVAIIKANRPTTNIVFTDAIPLKSNNIVVGAPLAGARITDYMLNSDLAKSKTIYFDVTPDQDIMARAAALGVIPCLPAKSTIAVDLPTYTYSNETMSPEQVFGSITSDVDIERMSEELMQHSTIRSSYTDFVRVIQDLSTNKKRETDA